MTDELKQLLQKLLTEDVVGSTMTMVENCYLNMERDEFERFLSNYHKYRHKFEPETERCDACNGVWSAVEEIERLLKDAGYHKHEVCEENLRLANLAQARLDKCREEKEKLMSGQAFFDRLMAEIDKLDGWTEGTGAVLPGGIELAARRAAGLEDEQ